MRLLGLTGGIGSGKSTVAGMMAEAGIPVVDADRLAREAVAPGSRGLSGIVERFGAEILDPSGALDRPALGKLVFGDPASREALEAIVHPEVSRLSRASFAELEAQGHGWAVYDVPLLFETQRESEFDLVVVVAVSPETQRARVRERDGSTLEEIQGRIDAQMPLVDKAGRADVVIDNQGSLDETRRQVEALMKRLQELR
ncbi:MAG: dephospho-CoA kinase [Myxococcota bacterium]